MHSKTWHTYCLAGKRPSPGKERARGVNPGLPQTGYTLAGQKQY